MIHFTRTYNTQLHLCTTSVTEPSTSYSPTSTRGATAKHEFVLLSRSQYLLLRRSQPWGEWYFSHSCARTGFDEWRYANCWGYMGKGTPVVKAACSAAILGPSILCNPQCHYHVHNRPPHVCILSQIKPFQALQFCPEYPLLCSPLYRLTF